MKGTVVSDDHDVTKMEFDPFNEGAIKFLSMHGGRVLCVQGRREVTIRFPNVIKAASWVSVYDYEHRSEILDDMTGRALSKTVDVHVYLYDEI